VTRFITSPVEEMIKYPGLLSRTFQRRVRSATRHTPISYVQSLRIEEGKRRKERTDVRIERISWTVG
jgi:transcriptional regulator GlxA family with amidase domain